MLRSLRRRRCIRGVGRCSRFVHNTTSMRNERPTANVLYFFLTEAVAKEDSTEAGYTGTGRLSTANEANDRYEGDGVVSDGVEDWYAMRCIMPIHYQCFRSIEAIGCRPRIRSSCIESTTWCNSDRRSHQGQGWYSYGTVSLNSPCDRFTTLEHMFKGRNKRVIIASGNVLLLIQTLRCSVSSYYSHQNQQYFRTNLIDKCRDHLEAGELGSKVADSLWAGNKI